MNCRKCIFAQWDKGSQTGCSADRLSKFIDKGKTVRILNPTLEDESNASRILNQTFEKAIDENIIKPEEYAEDVSFYELTQLCNLYRTSDWGENKDPDKLLEIALKEVKPNFGIMVYDSIEENSELDKTLESIQNIEYDKKHIRIIISAFKERGVQHLITRVVDLQAKGFECFLSIHHYVDNEPLRDRECVTKLINRNPYIVKIPQGSKISKNFFTKIETSLNHKLEQLTFFEDVDNKVTAVPFSVVNNEYLNYLSYDLMVEGIRNAIKEKQPIS